MGLVLVGRQKCPTSTGIWKPEQTAADCGYRTGKGGVSCRGQQSTLPQPYLAAPYLISEQQSMSSITYRILF